MGRRLGQVVGWVAIVLGPAWKLIDAASNVDFLRSIGERAGMTLPIELIRDWGWIVLTPIGLLALWWAGRPVDLKWQMDKTFENETIEVGGKAFVDCVFRNCRFRYRGGPFRFEPGCRFEGYVGFETPDATLASTVMLLKITGHLQPAFAESWRYRGSSYFNRREKERDVDKKDERPGQSIIGFVARVVAGGRGKPSARFTGGFICPHCGSQIGGMSEVGGSDEPLACPVCNKPVPTPDAG